MEPDELLRKFSIAALCLIRPEAFECLLANHRYVYNALSKGYLWLISMTVLATGADCD